MDDPGAWVRAARTRRRFSQRELAARSGVPQQTIARVENGRRGPQVRTFVRLLGAAGFGLVLVDPQGRPLWVDEERNRIRDAAGRHLPAHLPYEGTPNYIRTVYWWGWHRVAWANSTDLPEHIWFHRPKEPPPTTPFLSRRGLEMGYVWDDAT